MNISITRAICMGAVSYVALAVSAPTEIYAQSQLPAVSIDAPNQQARHAPVVRRSATSAARGRRTAPAAVQRAEPVRNAAPTGSVIGTLPAVYAGGQVARGGQMGMLGNADYMSTPFVQNSYTAKLIKDQQATRVSDILLNDPTIRPTLNTYSYQENFMMRGVSLNARDMAFDGLYGITGPRSIEIVGVERVEVLHGASAFVFGFPPTGSVAGVVNLIPKRATDSPITEVALNYMSRGTGGASFDVGRRYGEKKEWGLRVNGVYLDGEAPIQGQTNQHGAFTAALDYRGDRFRATFDLGYSNYYFKGLNDQYSVAAGVRIPDAPDVSRGGFQPWGTASSESLYGAARLEYDLSDAWTLFGAVGGSQVKENFLYGIPTITSNTGTLSNITLSSGGREDQLSWESGVRGKFWTGPVKHTITLAGNGYHQEYPFAGTTGYSFASNLYAPVIVAPPPSLTRVYYDPAVLDRTSVAFSDTMSFFDGKLELTGGVRQQWVDSVTRSYTTNAVTANYSKDALTPMGAVVVRPIKEVSFYASYAEGFSNGPTAPLTAANPGQQFAPVVSKQTEGGVKIDLNNIGFSAAIFNIELASAFLDPTTRIYAVNGLQTNRGFEFNAFGSPVEGVRVLGGFQVVDGTLSRTAGGTYDGRTAPGVPHVQAVLSGEYDLPFIRGLTATGRVIYTDMQYFDQANTQSIPSWTRFDLGARYAFDYAGTRYTTRFSVENVGGLNYWASTGSGSLSLGAPRTFKLSVTANF